MSDFAYAVDESGIATITWDVPGRSMNVMSLEGLHDLEAMIDRAHADPVARGIVITSGKKDFAGGMDLNALAGMKGAAGGDPARGLFDGIMAMHHLLRKIELAGKDPKTGKGGKPTVAALPGTTLGIGLELALACHHRIAADNPAAKVGFPEIKVGLFPGAGGTTRVSRMLGIMAAAPILLEGRLLAPEAARSAGLIDEVVLADELLVRARAWCLAAQDGDLQKPWERKGWKFPGGAPYTPAGFMTFVGASAMVNGQTMGVYPAARALLSAVYEGALVPFDQALRVEARWFTHVLLDPASGAMIRTNFLSKEALEKGARRPADVPDQSVRRLGVIGAGMMGAGIAHVAAVAGIEVVLLDATEAAAERGKAHSAGLLEKAVARGRMTADEAAQVLAHITPGTDYGTLAQADLVIEAVFEDPKVKAEVTARAAAAVGPDCILATNTSTLPISQLAKAALRPEQFIGIHFFSPVDRMALVEIIRGARTGDRAVARALDFVRQLRKTPIVVRDARFFYANRCIIPYLNEGMRMLGEGVAPPLIENAARLSGMPVGPLQLVDETSIALGMQIAKATRAAMGDAYPDGAVDKVLFWMADQGRLGRKAGKGFYAYDDKGRRTGLWEGLGTQFAPADPQPGVDEVKNRLLMVQVLEAVRALGGGVLSDIREGDVGAVLGWGFAPWSGGPFAWLDRTGAGAALELAEELASRHGGRFAPPALLREMARDRRTFYAPAVAA